VIIPNLLYFGKTKQYEKYQLQDPVNLIKIIVESLNLQKFDLIGISYGGLVAIEFCDQNIEVVNKLILVDSPIKYFNDNDLKKISQIYNLENIEELFAPRDFIGLKK
jgi:pimeloyl-ACP methyl ester carboxylesterase